MTVPNPCPGRDVDLATHAVGALDGRDLELLETHLLDCPNCREYLEWLNPAVQALPLTVEMREPPASLKSRIMADVDADLEAAAEVGSPSGRRSRPTAAGRSRFRFWSDASPRAVFGTALAATVLLIGAAIGISALTDSGSPTPAPIVLESGPTTAGTHGTLEIEGDSGTVKIAALPELESDRVFQMWIARDGEILPGEVFVPADGSEAELTMDGIEGVEAVMVSEEPAGGSAAPTSDPILAWEITDT